ncbi:tetratricopeptide repeat-containing sensor histidine kinase [Mucilaginibacter jinjuensis]|uniref:histidine kinase n=1 Tax=Mucilaginibacter jinjuensis TaxID=1176721 RepID=A0ABY7T6L1_9SPHI|nr:tetratricopeptide repeat-containing sensor histidine kinase [Mucilaginibacter jinjuensis]WCT11899.1 tetratricopeptide repeat-containing sensor histidine kinase [Mucilaginibacter jinjuensis]
MSKYFLRPVLLLLLANLLAGCKKDTEQKIITHPEATELIAKLTNVGVNHTEERLYAIDSVYTQFKQPGVGDLWEKYNFLALCSKHDRKFHQAVVYADSAIWVIRNYTHDPEYSILFTRANITKGGILLRINSYDEASQVFYKAKTVISADLSTCKHRYLLALVNNSLADVNYRQQHYKEAIKLYKRTVESLPDCGNGIDYFATMQGNLDNVGLSFMGNNQPDSAIVYYNKALAFIEKNAAHHIEKNGYVEGAKGVVLGNRAKAYRQENMYDNAARDYKESIRINSRKGYENGDAIYAKIGLGGLYLETHKTDSTKIILNELEPDVKTDTVALLRYLKLKSDYLKATGDFKLATRQLETYVQVKEEDDLRMHDLNKLDLNKEFKLLDQKYKLESLEKENRLKTTYLINAIVFCFMCMVVIVFFIRTRNRAWTMMDNMEQVKIQLRLAAHAIEQKSRDFGQVLNALEHDLKNPLTAISSMAEILLLEYGRPEDESEMIDLIRLTSVDLVENINSLLEIGNSPDVTDAEQEIINVEELLFSSVSIMKYRAREKDQTIYLSTPGEVYVKINHVKLWRVINNLLVNAIKFSKSHSEIYVDMQRKQDTVEISVKDTGIGIPQKFKNKLFTMFTEAKRTGTAGEQSFGLGLYTSKQILDGYGGKIWFESVENSGSIFYFSLPVQKMF